MQSSSFQPFQLHSNHTTYTNDLALTPTIMLNFGTSCGKKIQLDLDISNMADTNKVFALLDAVGSDDESDIKNLIEDSDTVFATLTNDAAAVFMEDTAGSSNHLDAVVHVSNRLFTFQIGCSRFKSTVHVSNRLFTFQIGRGLKPQDLKPPIQ